MTLVPRRRDSFLDLLIKPAGDLFDEMDKLLGFSDLELPRVLWTIPMVNVREIEGGQEIELAAPGLEKSDFEISVEGNRLRITVKKEVQDEKYKRREFSYSSFTRLAPLPSTANIEGITARYKDGLLIVSVPLKEESLDSVKIEIE